MTSTNDPASSWEEHPVSLSRSLLPTDEDWKTSEALLRSLSSDSPSKPDRSGSFGKTPPGFSEQSAARHSGASSKPLLRGGIAALGAYLTLDPSALCSDVNGSSWSRIVIDSKVPRGFYLEPSHASEILERMSRNGATPEPTLADALRRASGGKGDEPRR